MFGILDRRLDGLEATQQEAGKQAAARNTVGRFETDILSAEANREGLTALSAAWGSSKAVIRSRRLQ